MYCNFTIVIPNKDQKGDLIDQQTLDAIRGKTIDSFHQLFGGCTSGPVRGSWINEKGEEMHEEGFIVWSTTTQDDVHAKRTELNDLLKMIHAELDQEAVYGGTALGFSAALMPSNQSLFSLETMFPELREDWEEIMKGLPRATPRE